MKKDIVLHMEFLAILVALIGGLYLIDGKVERQGERLGGRIDRTIELTTERLDRCYDIITTMIKEVKSK